MRQFAMGLAAMLTLTISGCAQNVTGKYHCTGLPDMKTMELRADGSYTSAGSILGHAVTGVGKYTTAGKKVTLDGVNTTEGLTETTKSAVELERQSNGNLTADIYTCKAQ
jgi:hypothetical protein